MHKAILVGCSIAVITVSSAAFAQQPNRNQFKLPGPGTPVPDVSVYDASGEEFSMRELRGQYTVLVFGCLT
jgi:cytochrome oxidase Cu insertion factor (SCO1/SenC/PrrC family)